MSSVGSCTSRATNCFDEPQPRTYLEMTESYYLDLEEFEFRNCVQHIIVGGSLGFDRGGDGPLFTHYFCRLLVTVSSHSSNFTSVLDLLATVYSTIEAFVDERL